jgi:hypothetical protein
LLKYCSRNKADFITQTADSKQPSISSFLGQKITIYGSLWQLDFPSAYGSFMALFWQLLPARFYAVSGSFTALIISAIYEDCKATSMI